MDKYKQVIEDIERSGNVSFSKSGGPGGQNVNKVNTNVLLTMKVDDFRGLSDDERNMVRIKLANRVNAVDELFIQTQQERSQLRNRQLAVARMSELVLSAQKKPPSRKQTRPSKAARQRRLDAKKRRSDLKSSRRRPDFN